MSLADVFHQPRAQESIQRALSGDRVPHALLFHGPDGVGKERFAVGLAQLLLCSNPIERDLDPGTATSVGVSRLRVGCGRCAECAAVSAGSHPDLHLIYRQLGREHPEADVRKRKALEIGVDVLRHFVIEKVGLTPVRGQCKVFIIREADRITPPAQNAMLKTLEEPPGATFLILLVTSIDVLLPTTLSRCRIVRFDPLPAAFVSERLRSRYPDLPAAQVEWYGRIGDGSLGRAFQAVEDEWHALAERLSGQLARLAKLRPSEVVQGWIDESKRLGARYAERDPDITDTEASRRGLQVVLQLAADWYDAALRDAAGFSADERVAPTLAETSVQSDPTRRERLMDAIGRIAQSEQQLDLNVHTQMCLEVLVSDLVRLHGAVAMQVV